MPELPEVETVRRGLAKAAFRGPVLSVWRSNFDLRIGDYWSRANENSRQLKGRCPGALSRRGKYLLWRFLHPSQTQEALVMVLHLGMSGALEIRRKGQKKAPHTHLTLMFADERRLDYVDPRRFGGFRVDRAVAHESGPLGKLGPEPLSDAFNGAALFAALSRRRIAVRDALLNQRIVAGVGNIYAVEALHECGILPQRAANNLSAEQCQHLAAAIARKLRAAIELGGTTLKDYRDPSGAQGRNQQVLKVYGQEGQPCAGCGRRVERIVLGGRSAFFCPSCQR